MPLTGTAAKLLVPGRDQEIARYKRDYLIRNPTAKTGDNTQPDIDARVMADATAQQYANAVTIANDTSRATRQGQQLDDDAVAMGTARFVAVGASGAVIISAASSGTTILAGDEFKVGTTRYQCAATATYNDGDQVPITGIDTGPGTNQRAGTTGAWSAPRPGCAAAGTVATQSDGSGLSGGNPLETDDQLRARLNDLAANPPASGNDAQYQNLVSKTPNVAVQRCFTYPASKGAGGTALAFTLRPSQPGANRIPNATQTSLVLSWIKGQMPAADGIYMATITANPVNVNMSVLWAQGTASWADATPWPPYISAAGNVTVNGSFAITPTSFTLTGNNGTNPAPIAGQTIGFYNATTLAFVKKKIVTVTVSGTNWVITCDPSAANNDVQFAPVAGQPCSPWSDSLSTLVLPVVSYLDTLGPGEMLAPNQFLDPGLRQRRSPSNPGTWPSPVTNRLIVGVEALANVQDAIILDPAIPYAAPVGTPGTLVYLNTLGNFAVFPE